MKPKLQEIKDLIDDIVQQRREAMGVDEINVHFERIDFYQSAALTCHLTDSEKQELQKQYRCRAFTTLSFVKAVCSYHLDNYDYSAPAKINTPFKQLLADYTNKQSKRVSAAKQELMRRYESLDNDQQLAVRIAMLQASKTDCLGALKFCFQQWDGQELPYLQTAWERSFTDLNFCAVWYHASHLLLRHAPIDFIRANQERLYVAPAQEAVIDVEDVHCIGNVNISKKLYQYLCVRMCSQGGFEMNREYLNAPYYYPVMYHTHQSVDAKQWEADLYRIVSQLYLTVYFDKRESYYTLASSFVVDIMDIRRYGDGAIHGLFQSLLRGDCYRNRDTSYDSANGKSVLTPRLYSLTECATIDKMLRYGALLGFIYEVQNFYAFARAFDKEMSHYVVTSHKDPHGSEVDFDKNCQAFRQAAVRFMPREYVHYMDEADQMYGEWKRKQIERNKYEFYMAEGQVQ
ncbi:MAG: hypothetical protein MSH41_05895 [Bacteroidales bacterium]|nr:hypothetical protein [Bacteroidales bacterium]